ncbi:hypothetical protein ABIE58_002637 [Roseovarius sp. MBR-78]|uniref:hypothetical protein n=1 Tax=Roseovarius sp. MBR-78 TaxID=3156460 RepID=UPI00339569BE
MRLTLGFLAMAALAACSPAIPDSGATVDSGSGVGFKDDTTYQREKAAREAALAGEALPPSGAVSSEPLDATGGATAAARDPEVAGIAAEARAALDAAGSEADPVQASPSNPPPAVVNGVGISRENSFDAVGSERSIEEDAARIARNRAQYEVIQPEAIGARPGDVGPNIVDYALATKHPVGTQIYDRGGIGAIGAAGRHERNCAGYASPDLAQLDFLGKGGPERDRMALDPDGDGYACGWNPAPFRRAVAN